MDKSTELRKALNIIIDQISSLPLGLPLLWVYVWDVIKSSYPGEDLDAVWDKFWETADSEGWSLEYGTQDLDEHVLDWLIKYDFINEEEEDSDEESEDN